MRNSFLNVPHTTRQNEDQQPPEESRAGKKNTVAGSTNFHWGDANSHDNVGFTPYFDKNIIELKGPLPLTIFNKAWQDAALAYHAEKKQKTEESTEKGEWIVLHKANADKILQKDGFMVALRYDIRVRANAFAHRVVKNEVKSFSDISMFQQDVYDTAYTEARRYDELVFREVNPYATGGVPASWDPHTGSKSTAKSTTNPPTNNHQSKRANTPIQSGSHGPSHLPAKPRESRRGSGYQGKNYNPNHTGGQGTSSGRYHQEGKDGRNKRIDSYPSQAEPHLDGCPDSEKEDQVIWPEGVKCDMNITNWKAALKKANPSSSFGDVLEGFVKGFHQGIPRHDLGPDIPFYAPPNHSSALQAQHKMEESIQKEIAANRIFGPYTAEQVHKKFGSFRTNPLGAVVNGDGSLRAINDLSFPHRKEDIPSVNSFVNKEEFDTTWDDFKAVAKFLRNRTKTELLAIFDWEKAYRQIPTAPNQWPYLMLKNFDNQIIIDTRIAFGGVAGCGSFGRPADAWKHIMLAEFDLVTVFRWVDNNLFIKELSSTVEMDDIVSRSNELGVKTNPTKISPFKLEQKYIGFIWNAAEKTVRLPEEKIQARINQIQEILEHGKEFTFKQI
ncbi:hypothetical protein PGTUg99_010199 [Puccinia graminis f. sp. tritici]|uniref:Reverse transcriptase domain-containing protein n=1 Tax=Puccinia graminis f. sp. tritici TaxID=56615 RepID=A0A5B0SDC7_PUCGR|nr:hypothetical protein PGTUg99_010199 [Puccinia graminis f. sp. tritici]